MKDAYSECALYSYKQQSIMYETRKWLLAITWYTKILICSLELIGQGFDLENSLVD